MNDPVLSRLGWDSRLSRLFAPHERAGLVPGRVVQSSRERVRVATASGERAAFAGAALVNERGRPAPGDWVALDGERVAAVLERTSALVRRDPGRPVAQVLAANVDLVLVVAALDPAVNLRRLERTLAVAWDSGAVAAVVLTKPDRCPDLAEQVALVRSAAPGADVFVVNGLTGEGTAAVAAALSGDATGGGAAVRTAVLVGPSGAGKSTLTNWLAGSEVAATGDVRDGDRKGRHTTSDRHMLVLDNGGVIIDTPGLRALAVWEVDQGVAAAFADIDELAAGCRFRDCRHAAEPGCAVVGQVDEDRLRNWRHLSAGVDPAEARRRARILGKSYRRHFKN